MKNRLRKVQFKYLDYVFENMSSIKSKHYLDSTFFKKGDKVILELEKSGTLWVLYSVWSNISDTFSFEYEETQQLIKEWTEKQLKSREVTPEQEAFQGLMQVEEKLKSEEITPRNAMAPPFRWRKLDSEEVRPHILPQGWSDRVEEELESVEITPQRMNYVIIGGEGEEVDYNSDEITPKPSLTSYHLKVVEEQLKKEEITPKCNYFDYGKFVEERLESEEIKPTPLKGFHFFMNEEELKSEDITPHLGHTYEMGKIDEEYEKK